MYFYDSQLYLSQRITSIDIQLPARRQRGPDCCPSHDAGFGAPAVEGADADGDDEVVWCLARREGEVFGGGEAEFEVAGGALSGRGGSRLLDRLRGALDG
ncbi:hypothetical protein [Rhizobium sp.]